MLLRASSALLLEGWPLLLYVMGMVPSPSSSGSVDRTISANHGEPVIERPRPASAAMFRMLSYM
jgi:hypothetical protein